MFIFPFLFVDCQYFIYHPRGSFRMKHILCIIPQAIYCPLIYQPLWRIGLLENWKLSDKLTILPTGILSTIFPNFIIRNKRYDFQPFWITTITVSILIYLIIIWLCNIIIDTKHECGCILFFVNRKYFKQLLETPINFPLSSWYSH